ncbi:MAG TPA: biotin--[acetyl-CoA-carboxylase] ligase [Ktedonobacterales bacterium]|nr:biotin--[acetyl-CoA-carboxylase] ligase [Ktedonobacterales bacterium]
MADSNDNPASQHQPLDIAALDAAFAPLTLGRPLIYHQAIESTNSEAMALARRGGAEGTLVTTDNQTAGRGRLGRVWLSLPNEQLALSLVLRPPFSPHFLVMASALAVAEAIEATTGLRPGIKWPNDVQIDGRKVCGILIETSEAIAVLGIGINVNGSLASIPELAGRTTTLADALGHPLAREPLFIELVRRLDGLYVALRTGGEQAQRQLREAWRARLVTLGQHVTILQTGRTITGIAEDVDATGGLVVAADDGTRHTITWGDVE